MTDDEVALAIEDHFGVNSQVTSEDLRDQFYKRSQNYYERKLGELQPIGGCENLYGTALPSNITYVGKTFTLKDRFEGKKRIAHVRCDGSRYANESTFISAANVSIAFNTDASGKWGQSGVGIANAFIGTDGILLVATGFGVAGALNQLYTSSLPVSGDTKYLRVAVSSPFADTNITGIEVYARVISGYTAGTPYKTYMFVGYIDLVKTPSGNFDFLFGPITLGADPTATKEVGSGSATYTATGTYSASGTLIPGRTYYITVMSQHLLYAAAATDSRCHFKNSTTVAVTLARNQNAISVSLSSAASSSTCVAIGTSPQLMLVAGIFTNANSATVTLTRIPSNAALVNVDRTGASTFTNVFASSKIYVNECFMYYDSTYSAYRPLHLNAYGGTGGINCAGIYSSFQTATVTYPPTGNGPTVIGSYAIMDDVSGNGDWSGVQYNNDSSDMLYMTSRPSQDPVIANGVDYAYAASRDDYGSYVLDYNTDALSKIFQTDGYAIGRIIVDYQTAIPPKVDWLMLYQESLVGIGGAGDASNRAYFTEATNPYNWGTPITPATAQFVQCESGGEGLNGGAVYTNTTGTSGPMAQLLLSKPNKLYILSELPIYSTANGYSASSLNNAFMTELSGEIGSAGHECFQNTDVGLIGASIRGVWLIRESGEPTPIGEEIKNFLIDENPSLAAINTRYWHAVYHDGHYKLVYSVQGAANPTKELWLDISKMKQMKGQPCWNGPHTERSNQGLRFSYSEGPYLNQNIPVRIGSTGLGMHWGTMDNPSVTQDFAYQTNAVQQLSFSATPSSGSITLTYGSLSIAVSSSEIQVAATVESKIRTMSALSTTTGKTHRVQVTGTYPTYLVEFFNVQSPSTLGSSANTLSPATTLTVTTPTAYAAAAAAARTYIWESRDFPLSNALANKLHTRTYYRMKIDQAMTFTEETTVLNEAGESTESVSRDFSPITTHSGGTYTTFLLARQKVYPFFPQSRLRGETVRKKLTYTGNVRHAFSGYSLFFKPERRRI